jgi:hypothetical protein
MAQQLLLCLLAVLSGLLRRCTEVSAGWETGMLAVHCKGQWQVCCGCWFMCRLLLVLLICVRSCSSGLQYGGQDAAFCFAYDEPLSHLIYAGRGSAMCWCPRLPSSSRRWLWQLRFKRRALVPC